MTGKAPGPQGTATTAGSQAAHRPGPLGHGSHYLPPEVHTASTWTERWGNDPTLKRIADIDDNVKEWLRQAAKNSNEYQTPGMWLALRREEGLDRYDNNLAAAERFAMAAEGFWDVFPDSQTSALHGKLWLQKARLTSPARGTCWASPARATLISRKAGGCEATPTTSAA